MRIKIDAVNQSTSATQDGVREKLAIRAQLLDEDDLEEIRRMVGQVLLTTFEPEQQAMDLFPDNADDGSVARNSRRAG